MMPRKTDDLSGWGGGEEEEHEPQLDKKFYPGTNALIVGNVIVVFWLASGIIGTLTENFTMMQLMTPVAVLYATFLFGKPIVDRALDSRRNGATE